MPLFSEEPLCDFGSRPRDLRDVLGMALAEVVAELRPQQAGLVRLQNVMYASPSLTSSSLAHETILHINKPASLAVEIGKKG